MRATNQLYAIKLIAYIFYGRAFNVRFELAGLCNFCVELRENEANVSGANEVITSNFKLFDRICCFMCKNQTEKICLFAEGQSTV